MPAGKCSSTFKYNITVKETETQSNLGAADWEGERPESWSGWWTKAELFARIVHSPLSALCSSPLLAALTWAGLCGLCFCPAFI